MEEIRAGTSGPRGYARLPDNDTNPEIVSEESEGTLEMGSTIDEGNSRTIDDQAMALNEELHEDRGKVESCYTVKWFLFFLTSFQLINLLTLTYTDSVLNYISKRFEIPNTMASFIPSSYQVGSMVAIVPVSHLGSKWHRPRAICIGVVIMIIGLGFCVLPHVIIPSKEGNEPPELVALCERNRPPLSIVKQYISELGELNATVPSINWTNINYPAEWRAAESHIATKRQTTTTWLSAILDSLASYYHSSDNVISPSLTTPQELPCNENGTTQNPSILLIIGHVFIGVGASPLWPLGVAYLDEHLVSRKMPLYLGIFIGTTLTGPVAGFLLGSLSSAIYVTIDAHNLKPTDPAWIGAWWLGYVIAGGLLLILLVPFYFFPRSLKVTEEKRKERENYQLRVATEISASERRAKRTQSDTTGRLSSNETLPLICEEQTYRGRFWKTISELLCSIRRILSSPLVICCFLAYIFLANLLSGVATFGSTFIQRQYSVLRITSDMLIGGVCVPLAIAGTFCGGYIMKKLNFTVNQSLLFNVCTAWIGTVFFAILFGFGCDTPETAGVTRPYVKESRVSITTACNSDCHCSKGELYLLCSQENVTYLSPCYAGCMTHIPTSKSSSEKEEFADCSCVSEEAQPLSTGPCKRVTCTPLLAAGIIVASVGTFTLCLCQAPTYTILLRTLRNEDKSLAIGLLTFLSRLLAFIPAPIWFALVIDKSCIYWGAACRGKAVCKLYNNLGLRLNFIGACTACSIGYTVVFAATTAWFMYSGGGIYSDVQPSETVDTRNTKHERFNRGRAFTR